MSSAPAVADRIEYVSLAVEQWYYIGIFGNTINLRGFKIAQVQPFIADPGTMVHSFVVLGEREVDSRLRLAWKAMVRHMDMVEQTIEQQRDHGWTLDCQSRVFTDIQGEKNRILVFNQLIDENTLDCRAGTTDTES